MGTIKTTGADKGAYMSPSAALKEIGTKVAQAIENQNHSVEGKHSTIHIHFMHEGQKKSVDLPPEVYVRKDKDGGERFVGFKSSILRGWWAENVTDPYGDVDVYMTEDTDDVWGYGEGV
jgi:hypothetical protein